MSKKIDLQDPSAWQLLDWDEKPVHPNLKRTDAQVNRARANRLKAPRVAEALRGRNRGEEFSKQMSLRQKGIKKGPQSEQTKQKNRESNLGKIVSENTKKLMSINATIQMNDPANKKANSEQAIKRLAVPENNPNYKGLIYSTNINTGEVKSFNGPKDFINTDCNYFTVLKRIKSGQIYRNCTWSRK
jgi:hypothetical protein